MFPPIWFQSNESAALKTRVVEQFLKWTAEVYYSEATTGAVLSLSQSVPW